MAVLTPTEFWNKWGATAGLFADNSTRDISESDMRDFVTDMRDSIPTWSTSTIPNHTDLAALSSAVPDGSSVKVATLNKGVGTAGNVAFWDNDDGQWREVSISGSVGLDDLTDVSIGTPEAHTGGSLRVIGDVNEDGSYNVVIWTPPSSSLTTPDPEDWPTNNTIQLNQSRSYNQFTVDGSAITVSLDRTGIKNQSFFSAQFNILNGGSVAFSADYADPKDGASSAPSISENGLYMVYGMYDAASGRNKVIVQIPQLTESAQDTTGPIATFNPATGSTGIAIDSNIVITFNEAIRNIDNTEITDTNVDSLIVLKQDNASGVDIAFDATINTGKTEITVNPTSDFANSQTIYCAVNPVEDVVNNASVLSTTIFTSIASGVPAAPTMNTPTVLSDTSINTTWSDEINEESYKVERRELPSGSFIQVAVEGINVLAHTHSGLTPNTTYEFRVRASNAQGDSPYSNIVSATTQPSGATQLSVPANVVLTPISDQEILVEFDNVTNATSYEIEYDTSNTFPSSDSIVSGISSGLISGLTASTEYFVRIVAKASGFTDSNPSTTQSATTLAAVHSTFTPTQGETGVGTNSVIILSLSELGRFSSGELTDTNIDAQIELEETISTNPITFDATVNTADDRITITPSSNLPASTQITARLLAGIETAGATPFPANSVSFTTGASTDTTAPTFVDAEIGAIENCIKVNFNEHLKESIVPALTSFIPRINTVNATVKFLRIIGKSVLCYIQENIQPGETIDIAYTQPGTDRLQDLAGNEIATFSAQTVANTTTAFDRGASAFVWILTKNEYSDYDRTGINRANLFRDRKGAQNFEASVSNEPIIDNALVANRTVMRGYDTVFTANNAYQILQSGSAPFNEFNYLHDGSDFTIFTVHHIPDFTAGDRYVFVTRSGGVAGGGLLLYVRSATQVSLFVANESATRPANATETLAATLTPGPHLFHCRYNSTNEEYTWGINDESFVTAKNASAVFSSLDHLQGELLDASTKAMSFGELLTFKSFLSGSAYTNEHSAIKTYWGI